MKRRLLAVTIAGVGWLVLPLVLHAAIYTPTQAELNLLQFADYWPGNGATLNSKTNTGADGVTFNFNTGYSTAMPPEGYSRTQFESASGMFTHDFTGLADGFSIAFLPGTHASPLQVQVRVFSAGGEATSSAHAIPDGVTTVLNVPLGLIPTPSQITGYAVEIFSQNLFTPETNATVLMKAAPQPPIFTDTTLFSFEGTGSGSLEGWGTGIEPDHTHLVVSNAVQNPDRASNNGVTNGTHALEIHRNHTGTPIGNPNTNYNFRWGSRANLVVNSPVAGDYNGDNTVNAADYTRWRDNVGSTTANLPNDATPTVVNDSDYTTWKNNFGQSGVANPAVQVQIHNIVTAINAGDQLAFDVSFKNLDDFPAPYDSPSFLGFSMYIQDGSGGFYQSDDFGFPGVPSAGNSYTLSLTVPLSSFVDKSAMNLGNLATHDLIESGTLVIGLATNTGMNLNTSIPEIATQDLANHAAFSLDLDIDNIRVRKQVNGAGMGGGTVPEPSTFVLIGFAAVVGWSVRWRRGR